MTRSRLASGAFIGARARSVEVGDFKVGLWRAARPAEGVDLHVHDDAHFVLALDGGYHSLARDPTTPPGTGFGPGALVWNPPGVEHRDSFNVPGGRFLSVSFMPPSGASRGEPLRLRGAVEATARRLVGHVARFAAGDDLRLEGLALDLAAAVLAPSELDEDPAPHWLLLADEMIRDLSDRPGLEVRAIASAVGVHPVSLARRYRRHFGRSPATAIRQARMDRTAALLARGVGLADLAARTGYADQSHLTREFTAAYRLSPGRYRAVFD